MANTPFKMKSPVKNSKKVKKLKTSFTLNKSQHFLVKEKTVPMEGSKLPVEKLKK